jgi:hypothetical protein
MLRGIPRLLLLVVCGAITLLGLAIAPSNAAAVPKVSGMTIAKQDWYNAKLTVRWKAVAGATYRLRWARNSKMTGATTPLTTRTAAGTTVGPLDRGAVWYFQARAVKKGKVGAWSSAKRAPFTNKYPTAPTPSAAGVPGGVKISWPYSAYASRYRVLWSEGAFGQGPGAPRYVDQTSGGWVGQTARSSTLVVPTNAAKDNTLTAVEYANPIFAQVQANNAYAPGSRFSKWVLAFPTPPTPDPGDPVRIGTYNLLNDSTIGSRVGGIATNIANHGVGIVALQETSVATATAVVGHLGAAWTVVAPASPSTDSQVIYDSTKFTLDSSTTIPITNYAGSPNPVGATTAEFTALDPALDPAHAGHALPFFVVSAHFTVTPGAALSTQNNQTGANADRVLAAIAKFNPSGEAIIVAGDFTSNNEPYGDASAAQPTFIKAGYYDAMAALSKAGYQYSTVNGRARQSPTKAGLGTRADYIVFKGFRGSKAYTNVANWSGGTPSDHNLVYADLAVPKTP